jgi:hypothetical protein
MPKISLFVPDEALAEIDASAGGNRSGFMVQAAIERARLLRRRLLDAEIAAACARDAEADATEAREWDSAAADGLD